MAAAAGAAKLSARRVALTATGVGAAAGCLGTWFEMSHGVVCIPVLTLPPLQLSQQVAVGSTVFGVAARQLLSATLYGLEPDVDLGDLESLSRIVDLNAAAVLAASGTAAAVGAAAFAARVPTRPMRKANGLFLVACSLFMNWRELRVESRRPTEVADENEEEPESPPAGGVGPTRPLTPEGQGDLRNTPASEFPRLISLGAASGAVLGFFGVGPAWLLAPLLSCTAPGEKGFFGTVNANFLTDPDAADIVGTSGSDERSRATACLAMVPPSLAAAWRHFQLGHVINPGGVAIPLAVGAVLGSAVAGQQLADVPCDADVRYGLSILLFAHGCWLYFKA